jgi:hypothetical protein
MSKGDYTVCFHAFSSSATKRANLAGYSKQLFYDSHFLHSEFYEKFEDTTETISSRILKDKTIQWPKRRTTKIEQHEPQCKPEVNSDETYNTGRSIES